MIYGSVWYIKYAHIKPYQTTSLQNISNQIKPRITLWLCQNSYWKMTIEIVDFPIKNGGFSTIEIVDFPDFLIRNGDFP